MQFTSRSEYAIRTILNLAVKDNFSSTIKQTSDEENIPKQFLIQIVQDLKKSGLIKTIRGATGGISLAKKPSSISVLDIINSVEENINAYKCLDKNYKCSRKSFCPLCGLWMETTNQIKETLRAYSIEKLLNN